MARSSTASLLLALCFSFALTAPGCGGTVSDSPAQDGGAGTGATSGTGGSGPTIVKGGAGGMGGSQTGGSGSSAKGGTGGGGGTTGKGGTSGKGGTGTGGSGDLFDLDVPPEAEPCYECVKDQCKDELTQCNDDPQCVAVATCLLDQCASNQSTQCALGCLEDNGLSLSDFNNPVVQTAIGIGQCAQQGCPEDCQAPGMGMGGNTGKGGGPGKGGNSGKGGNTGKGGSAGTGGAACSFLACGQACGSVALKCGQDQACQACAQDPSAPGCDTNAGFQEAKQCCTDNVAVCGGCQQCAQLIGSGAGGTGAGGDGTGGTGAGGDGTAGTGSGGDGTAGTGAGGDGSSGAAGEGAGGAGG